MNLRALILYFSCLLIYFLPSCYVFGDTQKPKILHLTFHKGCAIEFSSVANELSLELETWYIPDLPSQFLDGITIGNALYNIGHTRAENIWNLHKNYFETFDAIVVSDTAPLSRIFLQNGWEKPLIIWICNRFDYSDAASLDCDFPDNEYYDLFSKACSKNNVSVIGYTEFEHYYAKTNGILTGNFTITPGVNKNSSLSETSIPPSIQKEKTFFLPPYLNENVFMDLSTFLNEFGIPCYRGRYSGPVELSEFKGIIHLPYAWSNLAFFENIALGIPYFIPSPEFFKTLIKSGDYFHTNIHWLVDRDLFYLSEWYCDEHADFIVYFDSWEDLREKIDSTDFPALREKVKNYAVKNRSLMIERWKQVFKSHLD